MLLKNKQTFKNLFRSPEKLPACWYLFYSVHSVFIVLLPRAKPSQVSSRGGWGNSQVEATLCCRLLRFTFGSHFWIQLSRTQSARVFPSPSFPLLSLSTLQESKGREAGGGGGGGLREREEERRKRWETEGVREWQTEREEGGGAGYREL